MTPLQLRRALRHSRRRLAILVVLLGLGGAVAVHHGMPMDMHAMPGQVICLAVLGAAALIAGGSALLAGLRRLPRARDVGLPRTLVVIQPRSVPARAGPLYLALSVFRL